MTKGAAPAHLIDRVYALLHELEGEQHRRHETHEANDWLDGVRTGTQAAKRQLIARLHWVLDPTSEAVDLEGAGPLTARLNPGQLPETYDGGEAA